MKCVLDEDLNSCPYYIPGKGLCSRKDAGCTFQEEEEKAKPKIVRESRWYEKYYEKRVK